MASITIRKLDEGLKSRLRIRAAARGRSMEDEARRILQAALDESPAPSSNLADRIRRRFAGLGDVELPIAPREPMREPAVPDDARASRGSRAAKAGTQRSRPRA